MANLQRKENEFNLSSFLWLDFQIDGLDSLAEKVQSLLHMEPEIMNSDIVVLDYVSKLKKVVCQALIGKVDFQREKALNRVYTR